VANIVGVPLTTVLGQHLGWRLVYLLVGLIAASRTLGHHGRADDSGPEHPATLRAELRAFAKPEIWLVWACHGRRRRTVRHIQLYHSDDDRRSPATQIRASPGCWSCSASE